ncbi:tetratricopeptide repeat protein, partial [Gimesia chilikensis]|uniref:tetratricopeptide repeat protein n=1 Tax=Gimesia chilikensis TaxID=2605989 RepID=UPI0011EEF01D
MKNVRHKYNAHEVSDQERAATFAARQNILDLILRRLTDQTGSSLLLTGPRGAGKSTLVQMVRQKIEESEDLSQNWLPVILPEELIGVTSLRDFLSCILEQLGLTGFTTGENFHNQCENEFDEESSEALAIEGIKTVAKETNKTLLVAVENLDQLFSRALDDERMQSTLRRLLMYERQMCLLATSVSILGNHQEYDHPFWEYFEEIQLLPANDVETDEILKLRAHYELNDAFLNRYTQSHGLVRAINRLTGGNPRLIVMLYEVITMGDVESAVAVLRQLLDELTPLYNGLLDRLSNQHRKIVDAIMRQGGQAFVHEIASTARLPENTIRAQLKRLKDTGCVNVIGGGKGKEAVYTVEDRLFSTWYQLRYFRPQRRRIEIFIEVLRVWFSAEERQRQLSEIFKRQEMSNDLIQPELSRYLLDSLEGTEYYAKNHERWKSYYATSSNFKNADDPDTEFVPGEKIATPLSRAFSPGENEDSQQEIDEYTRIINLAETSADQVAQALFDRGVTYGLLGETQQEIEDYTRVIDLSEAPPDQISKALFNRGYVYGQRGETQQAIKDYTHVINQSEAPPDQIAKALVNRGVIYGQLGETQQAIEDYTRVIDLPDAPPDQIAKALFNRGITYGRLRETQQAFEDYTRVIDLSEAPPDQIAKALVNRGYVYGQRGETQQEIEDYTRVINLPEAPPDQIAKALVNRAITYGQLGETQQAFENYTHVINLTEAPPDQIAQALVNRGYVYGQRGETQQEIEDYT